MLKGFLIIMSATILLAATPVLHAQVYRCDGPGGTIFSDMPCGDSAKEIVVEGMEPEPAEVANETAPPAEPDQKQNYRDFLGVLNSQKTTRVGEVDTQLSSLRATANGPGFESMDEADRLALTSEIATLESERESIVAEYDGLIAEMERRIESNEVLANAQDQMP